MFWWKRPVPPDSDLNLTLSRTLDQESSLWIIFSYPSSLKREFTVYRLTTPIPLRRSTALGSCTRVVKVEREVRPDQIRVRRGRVEGEGQGVVVG